MIRVDFRPGVTIRIRPGVAIIRPWIRPGTNQASHGADLAPTWANLAPHEAELAPTWANLGPTWGQLGGNLDHLGRAWGQLARTLSCMDLPKLLLGCFWRLLGASWRPQGAVLAVQSGLSNSTWRPKALRGANSGGLELFQMPSWRRVAFPDNSIWRIQGVEEQSS